LLDGRGYGAYGNTSNDRIKDTLAKAQSMLLDDPFGPKAGVAETGNFGYAGPQTTFGIGSSQADYAPQMRVGSTNSRGGYGGNSTGGGGILRS
jgi:hypothetical protein